ncbi:hypothetical protein SAMN06272722_110195 [Paenibacillus sp. RU5A]|nr:hypothetical protein SAMN06272722_110195 [Paenibacillus sp. RU5A]SOC74409.1 hypothetical protein SAMN05880581_110195 [Paenibacillus sp. RU26A]SOC76567.1 hypothetical protein SAMN05880586_110195 [Paenibacillus sp. RU5M]
MVPTYQNECKITYFETPEKTQYLDQVVSGTISSIINPSMDDFTKEKVIHDWLVNRQNTIPLLSQILRTLCNSNIGMGKMSWNL